MFNVCSVFKREFFWGRDGGHGCWGDVSVFYKTMKFAYHQKKTSRGLVNQVSGGTMTILSRAFILISITSLLSACGALNNIYWTQGINDKDGKVFTVDAKQRHLLINPNIFDAPIELKNGVYYVDRSSAAAATGGGYGDSTPTVRWRMCSEAAPDVFAAVSSSFSADGGLSTDQKFQLGLAIAESAATIERTQTVNLLRESMYRTCERWLSGAIDQETFITQSARDQRSMVAVLAIEQLTGAVKGRSTVISGPSTESSIADAEKIVELMKAYRGDRETAQTARDNAHADLNKNHDVGGKQVNLCASDTPPDGASDDIVNEHKLCAGKKAVLAAADTQLTAAKDKEDTLIKSASKLTRGTGTKTGNIETDEGDGGNRPTFTGEQLAQVAQSVENIALQSGLNEGLMFCVSYLGRRSSYGAPIEYVDQSGNVYARQVPSGLDPKIRDQCLRILQDKNDKEQEYIDSRIPTVSATKGPAKSTLYRFLDAKTTKERNARRAKAMSAAKKVGFNLSPFDFDTFVNAGPEIFRQKVVDQLRKEKLSTSEIADLK